MEAGENDRGTNYVLRFYVLEARKFFEGHFLRYTGAGNGLTIVK